MRKALSALPGVRHVYIDYKQEKATVSIDKTNTEDDARLVKALDDAGFGATVSDSGKTPTE